MDAIDTNPPTPGRQDNVDIGQRRTRRVNASPLNVGGTLYSGTDIPCLFIESGAADNNDGRPDGSVRVRMP